MNKPMELYRMKVSERQRRLANTSLVRYQLETGEPCALRDASTVRREGCGNTLIVILKGAPCPYSTDCHRGG